MEVNHTIVIAVTNDISFDQRVQRITDTLSHNGYHVQIIGRKLKKYYRDEGLLKNAIRLTCFFNRGFLFYMEYNIRLFLRLIQSRPDIIYACDPDTLLASALYKKLFTAKGVYDSHEYFIETPELNTRTMIKWMWDKIEKFGSRQMNLHLTVNEPLAELLTKRLGNTFYALRNLPLKKEPVSIVEKNKIIIYQGVLNAGRGLEEAILMMEYLPEYELWIAGEGDLTMQLKYLAQERQYASRIHFLGKLTPIELNKITKQARYGYNLLNGSSLNYYYSLANKFFDYMAAGVPSINMNFPVYKHYIDTYQCGIYMDTMKAQRIAEEILKLDADSDKYDLMRQHAIQSHQILDWESEQKTLVRLFKKYFS
jgi:glycosyltransferase involved in cell wall biosynthesis